MKTYPSLFDALGDPTRRLVFERLRYGPLNVSQIADGLPISRPGVSQHLGVLKRAGLVRDTRIGTRRRYELDPDGLQALRDYFDSFWAQALTSYAARAQEEAAMNQRTALVRRAVTVELPIESAFHLFTAAISTWWPREGHSIYEERVKDIVWEERAGGEIYEVSVDDDRAHWADILVWEPPTRFILAWRVNPERPAATEVEVRFKPLANGEGTLVELEHRAWERLGPDEDEARMSYDAGWEFVLRCYQEWAEIGGRHAESSR